jgi:hypothetical protein
MALKQLTADFINRFIEECKKPDNFDKIKTNLIDPLIYYTFRRLYPYILTTSIIFFLTFILSIAIFVLIIKINLKNS